MSLHPIFGEILAAHFPALADTHRGWSISFDFPPIPCRDFDWSATSPDYDASFEGSEDGWVSTGNVVHGRTREDVVSAIDNWITENAQ